MQCLLRPEEGTDPQEMELEAAASCPTWALGSDEDCLKEQQRHFPAELSLQPSVKRFSESEDLC